MLKGNKTYLRAVELEDSRIISAWLNDRETNMNLDIIYPLSKRYADSYVLSSDEESNKKIFVIDNLDHKPIGLVIIDKIKWEYRNCEIGIVIYDKNSRGKGLGEDALRTGLDFIFNEMNMNLVYLHVLSDNKAALNLYRKLGFEFEGELRERIYKNGRYHNLIVMSKKREGGNNDENWIDK